MGRTICGIYDQRPEMCRRYPEPGSYQPEQCTFYFAGGERKGACDPECNSACCFLPREGGEPGGAPLPEISGGLPCKYITFGDEHPSRPMSGDGQTNTTAQSDRDEHRPVSDALELVLAEKRRSEGGGAGTPPVGS